MQDISVTFYPFYFLTLFSCFFLPKDSAASEACEAYAEHGKQVRGRKLSESVSFAEGNNSNPSKDFPD